MHIPDRVIVRKLREYDPHLFVEWNAQKQWFEVWRQMPHGRRLITPVTQSIYDPALPRSFVQLDERLLWWLVDADSWRHGGAKKHALEGDKRWQEWNRKLDRQRYELYRDLGKDAYRSITNFYSKKYETKNPKHPKITSTAKPKNNWIRPDSRSLTSPRLYSRSGANAKAYGFKR
jgi:hypothetical protein